MPKFTTRTLLLLLAATLGTTLAPLPSPAAPATLSPVKRPKKDDGALGSRWLPEKLIPLTGRFHTRLIARYDSPSGKISYFLIDVLYGQSTATVLFKIADDKASSIHQSVGHYPMKQYIDDETVISGLWSDHLTRWIRRDGKEAIQKRLDATYASAITSEEAQYFRKAGFTIPASTRIVQDYSQAYLPKAP